MTVTIHYFPLLPKFLRDRTKELSSLEGSSGGCLAQPPVQHRANIHQVVALFTNLFVSKETQKINMRQTDAVLAKQGEPTASSALWDQFTGFCYGDIWYDCVCWMWMENKLCRLLSLFVTCTCTDTHIQSVIHYYFAPERQLSTWVSSNTFAMIRLPFSRSGALCNFAFLCKWFWGTMS